MAANVLSQNQAASEFQMNVFICEKRQLTQHPLHDQHLRPGELGGFDPEDLPWIVCDGFIGQILDTFKAV